MGAGVSVNENALGGQPLGAVTGNGVAVVEVTVLSGVDSMRRLSSSRAAI